MRLFGLEIKKEGLYLLIFNLAYILGFAIYYILIKNYEFLVYVSSITFFFLLILITINKTKFSNSILWLLSFAGFLHMCCGGIRINGVALYHVNIFHIIGSGDSFILRVDQVMHFYGIFIITIIAYHLLSLYLAKDKNSNFIYFVTFFIGIGWGSLVENQEFATVVLFNRTGVGGYYNNALDLVFNAIGALSASIFLYMKNKGSKNYSR